MHLRLVHCGSALLPLPPVVRPALYSACVALHPLAQQFAAVAEAYDRGRPGYPPEAVDIAAQALGLAAGDRVADLGAGTGKLTATLVSAGFQVVAVEPLDGMRARLAAALPAVEAVAAPAEQLPFADGSLAACFSADAFHWFDAEAVVTELYRVLRPRGGVALLWHLPGWEAEAPGWWQELVALLNSLRSGHPGFVGEQGREAFARHGGFEPFTHHSVESTFATDREGAIAYVQSISYVAGHPERDRILDEVRAIVRDVEPHDSPVRTFVWLTRRRD
jgi:SAM-dependent methyltransferase